MHTAKYINFNNYLGTDEIDWVLEGTYKFKATWSPPWP